MSFQKENIGIMDEAYFVSRGDILKWANDLLQVYFCFNLAESDED